MKLELLFADNYSYRGGALCADSDNTAAGIDIVIDRRHSVHDLIQLVQEVQSVMGHKTTCEPKWDTENRCFGLYMYNSHVVNGPCYAAMMLYRHMICLTYNVHVNDP